MVLLNASVWHEIIDLTGTAHARSEKGSGFRQRILSYPDKFLRLFSKLSHFKPQNHSNDFNIQPNLTEVMR